MEKKKLIKYAKIIRKYCSKQKECKGCVFFRGDVKDFMDRCDIGVIPELWRIPRGKR